MVMQDPEAEAASCWFLDAALHKAVTELGLVIQKQKHSLLQLVWLHEGKTNTLHRFCNGWIPILIIFYRPNIYSMPLSAEWGLKPYRSTKLSPLPSAAVQLYAPASW